MFYTDVVGGVGDKYQVWDRANGQGVGDGVANEGKKYNKCWYKLELVWDFCLLKFPAFCPKPNKNQFGIFVC